MPWNFLPDLPLRPELWRTPEVLEQLGLAQEALGRLYGRSIAIPNQGLLINTISLQEAKASSAIENIFTTADELYRVLSAIGAEQVAGPAKEVLRYREALWTGYAYLQESPDFTRDYLVHILREVKQKQEGICPPLFPNCHPAGMQWFQGWEGHLHSPTWGGHSGGQTRQPAGLYER